VAATAQVESAVPSSTGALLGGATAALGRAVIQRKLARRIAQRQASGAGAVDANGVAPHAAQAVDGAAGSSGSPLPSSLQQRFEGSLGADLSGVRVHTGGASAAAADAVSAKAYTVGQDVHFGAG